jgi:hypothetical protein
MAKMWPKELPSWVTTDPRRSAEIKVYKELKKELDDSWVIYYSRPWWGINTRGGEVDGEADFIIANPDYGILFIEVKGGRIEFNPENDKWKSIDRENIPHTIKDPIAQSLKCKHKFIVKLRSLPTWPKFYVRFRHGAIFPDSAKPTDNLTVLGPHERHLFCFEKDFHSNLREWIIGRLKDHSPQERDREHGPNQKGMDALHDLVAAPVMLRVPLSRQMQGEIDEMEHLMTGAQLALISIIESSPRALIEGGAGTGKTVLAMEIAVRDAELGKKVIFCCKSVALAQKANLKLKIFPLVEVFTFAELNQSNALFENWDTIIIDEGQDFYWDWLDIIENLAIKNNSNLRIFADSNQAVYNRNVDIESILQCDTFLLSLNLRNTQQIAAATNSLYDGPLIRSYGPSGATPEYREMSLTDATRAAIEFAVHLIKDESTLPSDIAILVPNEFIKREIILNLNRLNQPAQGATNSGPMEVTVETIADYKGLEASYIILVLDRPTSNNQELSYVGVSRARSRLLLLGVVQGTVIHRSF